MKTPLIYQSILLFVLLINIACVDPIDFEQAASVQNGISIQGKLVKGNPSKVNVQIKEVFSFAGVPRLIDAKDVIIVDDKGNSLALKSSKQGLYNLDIPENNDFEVAYGKGYQIKVELNNNEVYESTFDTLYPVLPPTEIRTLREEISIVNNAGAVDSFEVLKIVVDTDFSTFENKKVNLLWEFESVYKQSDSPSFYSRCARDCQPTNKENEPKTCYININPIENYNVLRTSTLSGNSISNFTLLELPATSFVFAEGYYLTILQQSLSEPAYEYWATVKSLTTRSGTIFEPPSGKIRANIQNKSETDTEAFGYFFVTESEQRRIYIAPSAVNSPKKVCPVPANPDGSGPGNCCDCLCEINSTTEKPEWWVE